MSSSSAERPSLPRGPAPLAGALLVLSMLALGLLSTPLLAVRAAASPTLSVTLLVAPSSATQSIYQAAAAGFAAQAQITVTFGDGTGIPPLSGKTDTAGGFTSFWTLVATTKYCGTLTASDGTNTAAASFWVALTTDTTSGTACAGTVAPPSATAVATAAATAATVAPTQTHVTPVATQGPPPPPVVGTPPASGSSLGARVQRLIARMPGGLTTVIAGSVVAILALAGLILYLLLGKQRGTGAPAPIARGMPPLRGGLTPAGMPPRRSPGIGQAAGSRHPYDMDNDRGTYAPGGPAGPGATWAPDPLRAPQRARFAEPPGAVPVRTPPPWVTDPGATPGRTASQRMPPNLSARHAVPPAAPAQRWDRGRRGARPRRDDPPARTLGDAPGRRDGGWPPDPDLL